ncbi:transglycosylase SLT domain-containing protein [uncultured Roseobacter sp.]|uniref:transglycosylase SLT domain-containing protein n=1 Tax=uncultured Roseobacter sp. TaxID=114847 RepID=UPI002608312A|nr:transglycosylase SLT domain-containing protein [uncultured Roseobacter sp.]
MKWILIPLLSLFLTAPVVPTQAQASDDNALPAMRWSHKPQRAQWNAAALQALRSHGQALPQTVPADVGSWCPHYPDADTEAREAFWVGFLSALARYESTWKPRAVGGGGRWFGLLQISPGTARGYGCRARSGEALKAGGDNLSCAIRIMAVTVPRDGVIYGRGGKGVAADWGPMRSAPKREEMAAWLRTQPYCTIPAKTSRRPKKREER